MRLFEFDKPSPINLAVREYTSQGFKVIARGASALVLSDGSSVIKVGPKSDCWLAFAQNAINAPNPHLPKISKIQIFGNYYLAQVEKLKDTPASFFKTPAYKKIASWLIVNAKWKTPRDVYLAQYTPGQILKMANALQDEDPLVIDALKLVIDAKGSCNFDIHPDNIMLRGSTVVIQDPLTHQG